ncbi:hypothetical protein N7520_004703 [Penicillium odoratum]|uniref:uncharacterized protein n=1 Tax=Penicillium odoratum TaxID=1167516 RepID=UPI002546ABBB|nr:uncharacterized protein N7520_004703 [Penicillium odoratum]KAJ5765144.1 hypothetical protein N7520_004703 [Penicillium odoratum]
MKTVRLREVCEVNGRTFTRKKGEQEWKAHKLDLTGSKPPSPPPPIYLSLIHYLQGEGEPLHWSLFFAREHVPGYEYQVKGDAEHMTYEPSEGKVNAVNADNFFTNYHLATMTVQQECVVRQVAEEEATPRAANRQSVTENCQGWSVRFIARSVTMGIIPEARLEMARCMLQSV